MNDVIKKWELILNQDSSENITYGRKVLVEILDDIKITKEKTKWISVSKKLPQRPDEDYLVVVRNKNKEGGIPIIDIANFTSDGIWIKSNTWEDVVFWSELPEPPYLD